MQIISRFLPKRLSMNCLNLEDILRVKMHGISCLDRITMNRIIQKEVVRVVKYDDDWNKLGQCSITSKNVYKPFAKGPLRMTENDGILYIHTSRYIYWDLCGGAGRNSS